MLQKSNDVEISFSSSLEKDRYFNFRDCHICPDKALGDTDSNSIEVQSSNKSGIGRSLHIKCKSCGCKQDITDYEVW